MWPFETRMPAPPKTLSGQVHAILHLQASSLNFLIENFQTDRKVESLGIRKPSVLIQQQSTFCHICFISIHPAKLFQSKLHHETPPPKCFSM